MEITPEIQAAIDSAVSEATAGLKAKNTELLEKNRKLLKGQEIDPQTVVDLEKQVEKLQGDLTASQKAAKDSAKALETLQGQLKNETSFTHNLLIDKGLTEELVKNGVAPQFLNAAKSMFLNQAQVVAEGETRTAKIGEKSITDFVKDWAASDDGKHFIVAPANSGGGSNGGSGSNTGAKTVNRSAFDAMSHAERSEFARNGGSVVDA